MTENAMQADGWIPGGVRMTRVHTLGINGEASRLPVIFGELTARSMNSLLIDELVRNMRTHSVCVHFSIGFSRICRFSMSLF